MMAKERAVFWHGDYVNSKGTGLMACCSEAGITKDKNLRQRNYKFLTCSAGFYANDKSDSRIGSLANHSTKNPNMAIKSNTLWLSVKKKSFHWGN